MTITGAGAGSASRAWRLLLLPAGRHLLEVSADGGERASLAEAAGATVTVAREASLEGTPPGAGRFPSVVLGSPSGPLLETAWVSAALGRTRSSEITTTDLSALLRQVARHLAPGATLVVSLPNPAFGLPGVAELLARVLGDHVAPPRARGRWRFRPLTVRSVTAAVEAAGFERVRCLAALPHAAKPKFLVPVGDPAAAGFFFDRLAPRPGSLPGRLAIAVAEAVGGLGLLGLVVPSWEILARRRELP